MKKFLSGKFLLTLSAGAMFIYATVARILPEEAVATIITMVFTLYFTRNTKGETDEKSSTSNNTSSSILSSD